MWRTIVALIIVATLLVAAVSLIPNNKRIEVTLIGVFPTNKDNIEQDAKRIPYWFPVSERPYTEASVHRLLEYFDSTDSFDFENYTYAVSLGYPIEYILKKQPLFFGVKSKDYQYGEAYAVVRDVYAPNTGYLYRMKKDWFDIKWYLEYDGNYIWQSEK